MQAITKMEVTEEIRAQAHQFYHQILARVMKENYKDEAVAEGGMHFLLIIDNYHFIN